MSGCYSNGLMKVIKVADLVLDTASRTVSRRGKRIRLSNREYELLEFLALNSGKVCNRGTLLEYVWRYSQDVLTNTVDVHMGNLRRKIDRNEEKRLIQTVFGRGYCLKPF